MELCLRREPNIHPIRVKVLTDQGKLKLGLGTMPVEPLRETGGEAMRHLKHSSEHSKSFPCMVYKQSRKLRAAVDQGPKLLWANTAI